MLKKRQTFYTAENEGEKPMLYPGRVVEARVIAVAPKVIRLEVFGVEVSVRARDMAWEWMQDTPKAGAAKRKTVQGETFGAGRL